MVRRDPHPRGMRQHEAFAHIRAVEQAKHLFELFTRFCNFENEVPWEVTVNLQHAPIRGEPDPSWQHLESLAPGSLEQFICRTGHPVFPDTVACRQRNKKANRALQTKLVLRPEGVAACATPTT